MDSLGPGVRAALITVGDELLLGRTIDTNAAWLARELADLGIPVLRKTTVGDVDTEIRTAVADATGLADLVLVSGGLGPTPDDLTRESVAGLLGLPLRTDPSILEELRRRFARRGRGDLPATNESQAQVPEGATVLENRLGTAPGLAMDTGSALVVLLPGVPRELRGIFDRALRPVLHERFGDRLRPVRTQTLHTTGVAESRLAQDLAELPLELGGVGLAYLPDLRGVDLRLTVPGSLTAAEAEDEFDRVKRQLAPVIVPFLFEAPDGDLAGAVLEAMTGGSLTLATAESCTGGLVGKRITDRAGSSAVYRGGVVAYANDAKERMLGVDPAVLEAHGAVSRAVAELMAEGACRTFGADAAVAVTGVAGPGGGTEEKPVGMVWLAGRLGGRTVSECHRFAGNREAVRERAAQAALFLLLRMSDGRA